MAYTKKQAMKKPGLQKIGKPKPSTRPRPGQGGPKPKPVRGK